MLSILQLIHYPNHIILILNKFVLYHSNKIKHTCVLKISLAMYSAQFLKFSDELNMLVIDFRLLAKTIWSKEGHNRREGRVRLQKNWFDKIWFFSFWSHIIYVISWRNMDFEIKFVFFGLKNKYSSLYFFLYYRLGFVDCI